MPALMERKKIWTMPASKPAYGLISYCLDMPTCIGGLRRRMVQSNHQRALSGIVIWLDALQFAFQKCQLIIHNGIMTALRGDHPRPLQHIAVESNNQDKSSIHGEIDCRLRHYASTQHPGVT